MFQKILVAIDNSELSRSTFEQALALAQVLQARLMLVYVLSPMTEGYPDPVFPGPDAIYTGGQVTALDHYAQQWKDLEQHGLELLQFWTSEATAAGVLTEYTQPFGDPGYAICTLARTWEADLIIIGHRGLTGWQELFLGSVSNYVTHHAACAVLTVPGQKATGASQADTSAEVTN